MSRDIVVTASLDELAKRANAQHVLAEKAAHEFARTFLDHAMACGAALAAAKEQVAYGQWGAWLESNFNAGQRTAQRYMQVEANRANLKDEGSVRAAVASLVLPEGNEEAADDDEEFPETGGELNPDTPPDVIDPPSDPPADPPADAEPAPPDVILDHEQQVIPDRHRQAWAMRIEADVLVKEAGDLLKRCETYAACPSGAHYFEETTTFLKDARTAIRDSKFYAVCPVCKGDPPLDPGCRTCAGVGWVTERVWKLAKEQS